MQFIKKNTLDTKGKTIITKRLLNREFFPLKINAQLLININKANQGRNLSVCRLRNHDRSDKKSFSEMTLLSEKYGCFCYEVTSFEVIYYDYKESLCKSSAFLECAWLEAALLGPLVPTRYSNFRLFTLVVPLTGTGL